MTPATQHASEVRRGLPHHGGDVVWATAAFPSAPRPFIDLSTGINPWSYPAECTIDWRHLPRPSSLEALLSAARTCYGVPADRDVIAVSGAELAIRLLPHILGAKDDVEIVGPTYSSHIDAWKGIARNSAIAPDITTLRDDAAVVVIVSPNNPDGRVVRADQLRRLAEKRAHTGGLLIVDRSFADVSDEPFALHGPDNLIELRSFGKFFGLPGLRLAFVISAGPVTGKLRKTLGAWPLNTAALAIGERALNDTAWQKTARLWLAGAAGRLDDQLGNYVEVIGGTHLFRLARVPVAADLFRHLGAQGVLTRIFDYQTDWIRIGLPPDTTSSARLDEALAAFFWRRP